MVKDKHIISEIDSFFSKNDCNRAINCIIGTISRLNLNFSGIGIEKRHNCKLTSLQVLELLLLFPFFMVRNSFQYSHSGLSKLFSCRKDMFYRFLEQDHIDWRKLVYRMSLRLLRRTGARSDSEGSLQCLIIDDTDLPKTGFKTELIGRIYSHVLHRSILGFKGLFLCHTDGKTQTMLDFSLHGEEGKNPEKIQGLTSKQRNARFCKVRDEKSVVNTRIREYKQSKIERSIEMVRHAMKKGIRFDYLLVDSWFTCADLIRFITSRHLECHLIGMLKMGKTRYRTEAGNLNAPVIIDRLKKEKSVRYSRKLNCYYAHMDAEYAQKRGYPGRVVYGMLGASFFSTLAGVYLPGEHCLLHGVECKFAKPVFIGDTLTITGTVVNVSEAVAEAEIKAVITNQDGKRVTRGIIKAGLAK